MKTLLSLILSFTCICAASADEIGIGSVLRFLHPNGDWMVSDAHDGRGSQIVRWNEQTLGPRPSDAQVAQAKAAITALRALRAGLLAEFATLSPGEQAIYQPAFSGIKAMLDAGNISEARKIVFLSAVPTEELAAARLRMLALFAAE